MVALEVTPQQLRDACNVPADVLDEQVVAEAGLVCRNVYDWTGNELASRAAEFLVARPLRIALVFAVAWVLNRLVRRMIRGFVASIEAGTARTRLRRWTPKALQATDAGASLRSAARAETIGTVLRSVASIVIYSIAALTALAEVNINLGPLIAGAGIAGVALGFGAQSLVKDFLSGLFMLVEDQYGVGDVIDVGEATGTVEVVNLRTTRLRDVNGTVWHVPNGEIRRVGNMSQQWARALVDVTVAYETDLDHAMRVVKEVADALWKEDVWKIDIIDEPEVWGVQQLASDGVTIRLVLKTQPGRQWAVNREVNRRIKDRFDAEGIEIPYPQQVMRLRRDDGAAGDVDDPTFVPSGE